MTLLTRISRLVTANINHLLDQAEDPEVMVKQMIREMEESIIELRRETVRAVAREKQLQKQMQTAEELVPDLEDRARLALKTGDEALARQVLAKKLNVARTAETLRVDLSGASKISSQLKSDLLKLEDQVQLARRKRDELIRRKKAAEAQIRMHEAVRRSTDRLASVGGTLSGYSAADGLHTYEDAIVQLEAEAEAAGDVLRVEVKTELDLQKLAEENAIDEELARLKRQQDA